MADTWGVNITGREDIGQNRKDEQERIAVAKKADRTAYDVRYSC